MQPIIVYAVKRPVEGGVDELFLPYPGGFGVGSKEAAEHLVKPNKHLGYEVVQCIVLPTSAILNR